MLSCVEQGNACWNSVPYISSNNVDEKTDKKK